MQVGVTKTFTTVLLKKNVRHLKLSLFGYDYERLAKIVPDKVIDGVDCSLSKISDVNCMSTATISV